MAETGDGGDLLKMYTKEMGKLLGPFFHHLWQDLAHLHLSWNEYVPLFGTNETRVDDLNRATSHFFGTVQDIWWNDLILLLWKLTDKDVANFIDPQAARHGANIFATQAQPEDQRRLGRLQVRPPNSSQPDCPPECRHPMRVRGTPLSSRADIMKAIAALDEVFNVVHAHYTGEEPMIWEHLDALGGSEAVLWVVRRRLAARDDDFRMADRRCVSTTNRGLSARGPMALRPS